jgi:hypothetical protein
MRLSHLLPFLLLSLPSAAQIGRQEVHTDTGKVVLHFFDSGEVSTLEWTDRDDRWGRSKAFKRDGTVIFDVPTRRIAGHAYARYTYHPNGAVHKVEFSSAPDGGIQWYRSTTTFDRDGDRTDFKEFGRDNYGIIPRPKVGTTGSPPDPPQQEAMPCQRLFNNEVFVVNPTNALVRVVATPKHASPAMPGGTFTLAPDDTLRIGSYTMGEAFPPWQDHLQLDLHKVVRGNRRQAVARTITEADQVGTEHRRLYVVITGWTKLPKEGRKSR